MCNDEYVLYQGGICHYCGDIWSVQRQDWFECYNASGTRSYIKRGWICDWPEGHPAQETFGAKVRYDTGNMDNDDDTILAGTCIRCESEVEWDKFVFQAEMDSQCEEDFTDYLHEQHPLELDEDAGQNKWWRRPYNPTRLDQAGFGLHD